ncbi:MAG TPA: copper-binding protein [Candidatus Nitrosotalea sp.]|nr:copper-binding protein [Candidatus Nitrosotalea sp.]
MSLSTSSHAYGIGLIAVIVGVAIGVSYYQLYFVPELNATPVIPVKVKNPDQTTTVTIVKGSIDQTQTQNFLPKKQSIQLGIANRVTWQNNDDTIHFVTPVKPFKDTYSGDFGSAAIPAGKSYTFLFTQEASIPYYCKVHPWMTGEIDIEHGALTS